jgi:metal-responsive CopG/Arc/MetJ family transcriptional regulator
MNAVVNLSIPLALVEQIDAVAGYGGRSRFFRKAAENQLKHLAEIRAREAYLERSEGVLELPGRE